MQSIKSQSLVELQRFGFERFQESTGFVRWRTKLSHEDELLLHHRQSLMQHAFPGRIWLCRFHNAVIGVLILLNSAVPSILICFLDQPLTANASCYATLTSVVPNQTCPRMVYLCDWFQEQRPCVQCLVGTICCTLESSEVIACQCRRN